MTPTAPSREPFSYRSDPAVPSFPDDKPLIVFDGACVFCSRFAQIVLRRDTKRVFRLTTAQSPVAQALYRHYGMNPADPESSILLEDGRVWLKSEGATRVFRRLGLPWSLVCAGRILPRVVADWIYDRIARNRYRLFGTRKTCFVPSAADADRFVA